MKNQPLILLVVAVGCGLVAMLGVRQVLNGRDKPAEEAATVLVAAAEILPGVRLDEVNTRFVSVPKSSCPEGAVLKFEDVQERTLKVPVMPGDWILTAKLTEEGDLGAVASIPQGMAAVTIPVDATTSHSGMVRPGNRVDLLLTYTDRTSGREEKTTITVLEFVEVFAVDARVYGIDKQEDGKASNISLLVTPEQGKVVTLARQVGQLSTMLRAQGELDETQQTEISQEFLTNFSGNNLEGPSVMDSRNEEPGEEPGSEEMVPQEPATLPSMDAVAVEPAEPDIDQMIEDELTVSQDPGGSAPVETLAVAPNTWTMEIYQGDTIRRESITLPPEPEASGVWGLLKMFEKN
jgi:pilus assembly protein CpaB